MKFWDVIYTTMICIPPLFFCAIIVKYWTIKRRMARASHMIEDPEALEQAQIAVNQVDFRRELAKDHVLVDQFSSMQGYTANYMDQLVEHLSRRNLSAQYYFIESAPTGAITAMRTGTYEFYVPRGKEREAREAIQHFRQM